VLKVRLSHSGEESERSLLSEMQEKNRLILEDYSREMRFGRNHSDETVRAYLGDLERLSAWFAGSIDTIDREALRGFLMHETARGINPRSLARLVSTMRSFGEWLSETGRSGENPSLGLRSPKKPRRLPSFLSEKDVLTILEAFDGDTPLETRNRAVLELLYGCGLRASETSGASLADLNLAELTVRIRGKGDRERIVPVPKGTAAPLSNWCSKRPAVLAERRDPGCLFLSVRGRKLDPRDIRRIVSAAVDRAALEVGVSPHTFRHSFATHLLDRGAGLRDVQELLGHAGLGTTQIYTHLTGDRLMKSYRNAHPRGRSGN